MDAIYRERLLISTARKSIVMNKGFAVPHKHVGLNLFDGNTTSVGYNERTGGDTVLNKLGAIALDPLPLLCAADALIGDAGAAEPVCADLRLHIGEASAGGQCDKQHSASAGEGDSVRSDGNLSGHGFHDGAVYRLPELYDLRIGLPPGRDQRQKLVLIQTHVQRSHGLQCAYRAAVAEGELRNFTLLPQVTVRAMLFYGNAEHLRRRCAVDVLSRGEDLLTPGLSCKPRNDPRFNGREIRHDEFAAALRNERRADQF